MLLLLRLPAMMNSSRKLREEPDTARQELGIQPQLGKDVTLEAIVALLDDEGVKAAIRADLEQDQQNQLPRAVAPGRDRSRIERQERAPAAHRRAVQRRPQQSQRTLPSPAGR